MNIYYNPEKFGLEIVDEIDYSDGNYQFDTRVVWKDRSGKLFTDRDAGCSCPVPFEDSHLGNIDEVNLDELRAEVREELNKQYGVEITHEEGQEFIRTVELAMTQ